MATSRCNSGGTFFLCFFFALLKILDGIFARSDGRGDRADGEQRDDDNAPNPFTAILLHQPKKKGDKRYSKN